MQHVGLRTCGFALAVRAPRREEAAQAPRAPMFFARFFAGMTPAVAKPEQMRFARRRGLRSKPCAEEQQTDGYQQ